MRVKLLISRATLRGGEVAGDEIDVPDDEARRMIAKGQAQPVRAVKPERAIPKRKSEKANK